jgi:hypothetical protein
VEALATIVTIIRAVRSFQSQTPDGRVPWLAASDTSAASARDADLADAITTICHAHRQVSQHQRAMPPGTIVV